MTDRENKINYLRNIKQYLREISILANKDVSREDLLSIVETNKITNTSYKLKDTGFNKFVIAFNEKNNKRFSDYICELYNSNRSEVYLWVEKSNYCGLYKVSSIKNIDFSFPFDIDNNGIISFISSDFRDKLLLDICLDSNGNECLEVETQGDHWPFTIY